MNINKKTSTLAMLLFLGAPSWASVNWQPYSPQVLSVEPAKSKYVLLGFHKKGCGTCAAQDAALEKAGIAKMNNLTTLKVERKDSEMDKIYDQYGFNKNQWAAMVLLKDGKEIARLDPGVTDELKIKEFLAKVN